MVFVTFRRALAAVVILVAAATVARSRTSAVSGTIDRLTTAESQVVALDGRVGALRLTQLFERPPEDVQGAPPPAEAAQPDDPTLRMARLEAKLRDVTGRIETAEHDLRRMEEDVKKFKQEVDFRIQDLAAGRGKARRSETEDAPAVAPDPVPERTGRHRGDAFDPGAAPNAPGAPHALGGPRESEISAPAGRTSPTAEDDPAAPLDLTRGATGSIPRRHGTRAETTSPNGDLSGSGAVSLNGSAVSPGGGARAEFDGAIALLRQKQYQTAETNFQTFLQKHPRDRLAADAVYYLGETYALRGRQREAAEQFLKVSTDYVKSSRAPEGMVKLGVSLNALGAKEQACATFDEVSRKFPNASNSVKNSADRESKRARC